MIELQHDKPDEKKSILFEPWALGDALIAASICKFRPDEFVLVCQKKWHPIILEAIKTINSSDLVGIGISYESKHTKARIKFSVDPEVYLLDGCPVYSIRGDIRDYFVAKKIFRKSVIHMSGWIPFVARKISLFDLPFRYGLCEVKNRYEMWMNLLGLNYEELRNLYISESASQKNITGYVAIHVGAQWRSKQFPDVKKLAALIRERGKEVQILAGENDPLPEGIQSSKVKVLMGKDLIEDMKHYDLVVTNDSGPMHLSALLGLRTVAIGCISNIDYWAPPSVLTVSGEKMPKGYRPISSYWTDSVVKGWPTPEKIIAMLESWRFI